MNYKFPSFDATEFAPFEKKGFELVFRLLHILGFPKLQ